MREPSLKKAVIGGFGLSALFHFGILLAAEGNFQWSVVPLSFPVVWFGGTLLALAGLWLYER